MVDSQDEWPVQATIYIDPAWPIIFLHTRAYDQSHNCRNSIYQEVFLRLIVQLNNLCEMRQGNAHNKLVLHPIWKWINFIPLIKLKKLSVIESIILIILRYYDYYYLRANKAPVCIEMARTSTFASWLFTAASGRKVFWADNLSHSYLNGT